ncbi:putative ABC transport system permease protein [Entomortierella parvispora]|uniref:ABC transport system permease protein n=1 Tax=Entomortierella parvispora TaxID=205924 RepID=A0A9P3HA39_9FUNG|nr:putative ABC transport system permease protein [Entomortierella parvispora]
MDFCAMLGDKDKGDCPDNKPMVELQWYHVAIASTLIIVNGLLSIMLGLGLEKRLFISAIRCVVQLTIMGMVLQNIFDAKSPVLVMLMALLLITLGANEAVFNVSKRRHIYMFPSVLVSMGCSCLIIGTFGTRLAMGVDPLHSAKEFIPVLGMLLGNTMTAISLGLDQCLSQLSENKEKIELYLSMGATRWEACRPIAVEAMRRAMMPTINQMSIIGLISIPGMMTGQLIAGASVLNAAKSQQIIMFLISGAAAFGTLSSVLICLRVCFDSSDRLRPERIIKTKSVIPKAWRDFAQRTSDRLGNALCCCWYKSSSSSPSVEEGGRRTPTPERERSRDQNERTPNDQHVEATERTPLVRSS